VKVEPQPGKGDEVKGRVVAVDDRSITVTRDGENNIAVPRSEVKRIKAVRVGKEGYRATSMALVIGGTLGSSVWTVLNARQTNKCATGPCTVPGWGPPLVLEMVSCSIGLTLGWLGDYKRVYEVERALGRPPAATDQAAIHPHTASIASPPAFSMDTSRVVATLRRLPAAAPRFTLLPVS
jgi:hypothetical protein